MSLLPEPTRRLVISTVPPPIPGKLGKRSVFFILFFLCVWEGEGVLEKEEKGREGKGRIWLAGLDEKSDLA